MHACGQCQAPLDPSAQFCHQCGAPLNDSQAPTMAGLDATPHPNDPLIGREVIGQYVIRHKIGAGGMGAVYLADQPSMGRKAVIKVLHPWLSNDPDIAGRFENEARAVARLDDPSIVQLFNYGDMGDGTLFLAMEHLDGRTLARVIAAEGRIGLERAVNITLKICEALSESHRHEVVHRDLKPSNIMLVEHPGGERVKVLDFGVAKLAGSNRTSTGQPVGTPRYMSPEQLAGQEVDGRSDLYSLGLVLYEMLAGEPPFVSDTPVGYIHKHMSEAPPPLGPEHGVPPALAQAIMAALAKTPEERPANAASFADSLRAAMRAPATVAAPSAPAAQPAPVPSPLPAVQVASLDDEDEARPALMLVGIVLAAAALGGLVYLFVGRDAKESPAPPPEPPALATQGETSGSESTGAPEPPSLQVPDLATAPPTAPTGNTTPLPPLSPEATRLLERSVADLEREFFELLERTAIPPSSKQQVRDSYGTMARSLTPGPQSEQQRKTYLVQVIIGYRNTPPMPAGHDLPIAELEELLRTLEAAAPADIRMQSYEEMVKGFNDTARSDADRDYWRRYALVSLIGTFSGNESFLEEYMANKKKPGRN